MSDNPDLHQLRNQIDAVDEQLVHLLDERARLALRVAGAKRGGPIYRPAREAQVLEHVFTVSEGVLPKDALGAVYREIIAACRGLQAPLTVAYLGPEGTYSEEAARQKFGSADVLLPFETLDEIVQAVEKGAALTAVVPVENSSEGSIGRTLDLLLETPLQISGEVQLPIRHQLLSHASRLEDVTEVTGHPQALAQCRKWLDKNLPRAKRVPAASNAAAARSVRGLKHAKKAAIAGARAAEVYSLPVLAADIHDSRTNTTRFLILGNDPCIPTGADKTSLVCSVANRPGTLHALLAIFADAGINMTKLESRPSASGLWDYNFFIDIEGHAQDQSVAVVLDKVRKQAMFVKVLGSYPEGVADEL